MGTYCSLQSLLPLILNACLMIVPKRFILGCDMKDSFNSVFTEIFIVIKDFQLLIVTLLLTMSLLFYNIENKN